MGIFVPTDGTPRNIARLNYQDLDLNLPVPQWAGPYGPQLNTTLDWEADTRFRRLEGWASQGGSGPPGPPGPAGPPGLMFVTQYTLPATISGIGQGFSDPITQVEVNGNGVQRYLIIAQGTFQKSATESNATVAYIMQRSDGTQMFGSGLTLLGNASEAYIAIVTDVPPSPVSYWILAENTASTFSALAGATMSVWETG